ncbi:hypothetical protein C5167_031214 [Papaver somniferum]|nr:hypothetical protein C5167_031214 [Papaver somniferum]
MGDDDVLHNLFLEIYIAHFKVTHFSSNTVPSTMLHLNVTAVVTLLLAEETK